MSAVDVSPFSVSVLLQCDFCSFGQYTAYYHVLHFLQPAQTLLFCPTFFFTPAQSFQETTENDKEQGVSMFIKKEEEGGKLNWSPTQTQQILTHTHTHTR